MNPLVERLGWVLVHSLWQFALVALLAGVIVRAMRRSSAATRYGLLVAAMAVMVAAPVATRFVQPSDVPGHLASREASALGQASTIATSPGADASRLASDPDFANERELLPEHNRRAGGVSPSVAGTSLSSAATEGKTPPARQETLLWSQRAKTALQPWLTWIVAVWCLGVLVCSLRPLLGWHTLRRLQRVGVSPASDEVLSTLRRVSERLGLRRAVRVLQSTLAQVPVVVGYFRPVILLPLSLMTSLPAEQLEAILAHELAHVRRHDFLVNLLQTLIETLFFYHPAVWWLSHQIRVEREHCCDDLVVTSLGNRVEYGRALVAIAELRGQSTVLALGAADGSLLSRVRRIVGLNVNQSAAPLGGRWLASLLTLGLVLTIALGTFISSQAEVDTPLAERDHGAGRGSPDPAPTSGLPNSDDDTNNASKADEDLRSGKAAGSGDSRRAQILECDIVDTLTGQPITNTTTSFKFIKPKSGDSPETIVAQIVWGPDGRCANFGAGWNSKTTFAHTDRWPKGSGHIYFVIPDEIMRRADREDLEVQWRSGNHPDYENYAPAKRIPLKQFFNGDPKAARETLRTIKLTPKKKVGAKADSAVQSKQPLLEFRIAANLPEDGWEPVLPEDWEKRNYRDGRLPARKDHDAGFVWYPLSQPWRSDAAFVVSRSTPETGTQGNEDLHLLSDKPEHGMLADASWSVLEAKVVRGKRNPAPGEELGYAINVRLDDAGEKRFAELVSAYRDMSLAVVMRGEIVGKLVLKEPSARLVFGGHFTKEWAEELTRQLNGLPPDPLATLVSFYANLVTLQTVFDKVLPALVERAGRKLSLDTDSFKASGVEFNNIVTLKATDESLRQALDKVLGASHVKLDYRLSDDGKDLVVFAPPSKLPASASAPPRGLEFLVPYPKLHGLSIDMTEPQFLEIVKQQELKTRKTVEGEKVTHHIGLGDDHTLIVMFDKDRKCSGIQRVRGEDAVDETISLTEAVRDFNAENKRLGRGLDQPALTEEEVITVIKRDKWERGDPWSLNEQEIAAFKAVAESQRLPKGSRLDVHTEDRAETFLLKQLWQVRLMLPAIGHDGLVGLTIRDTKIADERIDPKQVAWGKPDADGLALGAYLSPRKARYTLGERVRLRLFVRNDGRQPVNGLTFYRTSHPMPDDFTVTDDKGAKVGVRIGHEDRDHPWVSGATGGGLAPGEAHAFFVPYEILIGGDGSQNDLIGRVIEARPGQKLQLKIREHNSNNRTRADDEPIPESGNVTFAVADAPND